MALQNQIVNIPIQNGDVTFKNYGALDIPANTAVLIDPANLGTSQDPPGVLAPVVAPSIMQMPMGITVETLKGTNNLIGGGKGRVRMIGAMSAFADGAIAYGQWVEPSNTTGKLGRVRLASGACPTLGICITATAADGDPLLILMLPGGVQRQSGTAVLVAGTLTISNVVLTANSVILVSRKTQGGTVTSTILYEAPSASRNVGAGSFVVQASVAAGTANAADTSTVDYLIIN